MKLKDVVIQNRGEIYARPRVFKALKQALESPLAIAAAPAGFGKTTAVFDFFSSSRGKYTVAWMRLTPADNHPGRFLRAMGAALSAAGADASEFRLADELGIEEVLRAFSLAVEPLSGRIPLVLVVDDFHLITSDVLVRYVEEIARMRINGVRLLVLSRTIPNFSLTELAVKNMVSLVTQDDLRFTVNEARGWLGMRDIKLSGDAFADLMQETDGWITGMYLHTVSLMPSDAATKTARFVQASSDDILDSEIFSRYDEDVRDFLMSVAPLDEFPLPLCRAVSGREDADSLFERAMRSNLFIKRVGDTCYIHHIFAGFLKKKLKSTSKEAYYRALETAGDCYCEAGDIQTGTNFYMQAGAHEKLIRAIGGVISKMGGAGPMLNEFKREEFAILCDQIASIPLDCIRRAMPLLEVFFVTILMLLRKRDEYDARVAEMFAYYESRDRTELEDRTLGELLIVDSFLTNSSLRARGEAFERAAGLIGGSSVFGNTDSPITLGYTSLLFLYYREQMPLDEIVDGYSKHWSRYRELLGGIMDGLGEILRGELELGRWNFDDAKRLLSDGAEKTRNADVKMVANMLLAKCAMAQGDYDSFVVRVEEVDRIAKEADRVLFYTMADYFRAYLAAAATASGEIPQWLSRWDDLSRGPLLNEVNGLGTDMPVRAFVFANKGLADGLEAVVPRMRSAYEAGGIRIGVLYCHIYDAISAFLADDIPRATAALDVARRLAQPEGLVMPFAERSVALLPLVQRLERERFSQLGDGFTEWLDVIGRAMRSWNRSVLQIRRRHNSVEKRLSSPLSNREAEVSRMISRGMSREEIMNALGITDNNLKVIMSRTRSKGLLPV